MVPNGTATGLDIGLSNFSLSLITLSFYTMCKSTTPVFLLFFCFAWGLERCAVHCQHMSSVPCTSLQRQDAFCMLGKQLCMATEPVWWHHPASWRIRSCLVSLPLSINLSMSCRPSAGLGFVILIICVGLILLVYGEAEFNLAGFIIVMTASALSGLRWTITQVLLQGSSAHGVGEPRLSALTVHYMLLQLRARLHDECCACHGLGNSTVEQQGF